jgi:2-polyprenyl-3-methyl-5-hydroxy-6-metoxy-1,4-benzoquinol methylase
LSDTVKYYDDNAREYCSQTVNVDMEPLYSTFLELVPRGGRILDAGCGSGRDTRYFMGRGYAVEAFDASLMMCNCASRLTGIAVIQMSFDDIEYDAEFDGIWACASLVHVPKKGISAVLNKLALALRIEGVMFLSFKNRDEEWMEKGRFFNGYATDSFRQLISGHAMLRELRSWLTADYRPNRNETWLNTLLRRAQ